MRSTWMSRSPFPFQRNVLCADTDLDCASPCMLGPAVSSRVRRLRPALLPPTTDSPAIVVGPSKVRPDAGAGPHPRRLGLPQGTAAVTGSGAANPPSPPPPPPPPSSKLLRNILSPAFRRLGLSEPLFGPLFRQLEFLHPFPVQSALIPRMLKWGSEDAGVGGEAGTRSAVPFALVLAETGTGKTAAFGLPLVQLLSRDLRALYALVVLPTRELAVQVAEQLRTLGSELGFRVHLMVGGTSELRQRAALRDHPPHVVVATPGRLLSHLKYYAKATRSPSLEPPHPPPSRPRSAGTPVSSASSPPPARPVAEFAPLRMADHRRGRPSPSSALDSASGPRLRHRLPSSAGHAPTPCFSARPGRGLSRYPRICVPHARTRTALLHLTAPPGQSCFREPLTGHRCCR